MSEEDGFRERLRECPEDETCRLVYADWLQDRERHAEAQVQRDIVRVYPELAQRWWPQVSDSEDYKDHWFCMVPDERQDDYEGDLPGDLFDALVRLFGCRRTHWCPPTDWVKANGPVTAPRLLALLAVAFASLPQQRQDELLATVPPRVPHEAA